jgi:hypothetical protein
MEEQASTCNNIPVSSAQQAQHTLSLPAIADTTALPLPSIQHPAAKKREKTSGGQVPNASAYPGPLPGGQ